MLHGIGMDKRLGLDNRGVLLPVKDHDAYMVSSKRKIVAQHRCSRLLQAEKQLNIEDIALKLELLERSMLIEVCIELVSVCMKEWSNDLLGVGRTSSDAIPCEFMIETSHENAAKVRVEAGIKEEKGKTSKQPLGPRKLQQGHRLISGSSVRTAFLLPKMDDHPKCFTR